LTLYLSEDDVPDLLAPVDAVAAVEAAFARMAAGAVEIAPRRRLRLAEGRLADMAASDLELGYAGVKTYVGFAEGAAFVVALFAVDRPELVAVIQAHQLGRLRTGAASAVAAKYLAREGATSLGVIGCGDQAVTQVACIRAALPSLERVVAYCRTERNLLAFCKLVGAEPA
jgi:ornithine cyclodeaminase/alanine dehydrogenase-like protein (mu-crystallin family)